jgi:ABC-type branched-subunit amino acid transport system ATPase component
VLDFADRVYVMVNGQISYSGETASLRNDVGTQNRLLGVGANVL